MFGLFQRFYVTDKTEDLFAMFLEESTPDLYVACWVVVSDTPTCRTHG
jgi:hypothetical protein